MTEKDAFRVLFVASLITAGALAFAIAGRQPAEFYTALRWICSIAFGSGAVAFVYCSVDCYRTCRRDGPGGEVAPVVFHLIIAMIAVAGAVVFNPIAEFHFPRKTWLLLDKVALGVLIFIA